MITKTVTDNKDALKPCPICGAGALKWKKHGKTWVSCSAEVCPVSDWNMAVNPWNTRRTTDTQLAALQGTIESQKQTHDALIKKLELAVKALREIVSEHQNHAPAERKMHQLAQQTLTQLGITL